MASVNSFQTNFQYGLSQSNNWCYKPDSTPLGTQGLSRGELVKKVQGIFGRLVQDCENENTVHQGTPFGDACHIRYSRQLGGPEFAILKLREGTHRAAIESTAYFLSLLTGSQDLFVPSFLYQYLGNGGPVGTLQPYLSASIFEDIDESEIFNGTLALSDEKVMETLINEIQFGMSDARHFNLKLDANYQLIQHFDTEHDLPLHNGINYENGEEATPPFCLALFGHPMVLRSLGEAEVALFGKIVSRFEETQKEVQAYLTYANAVPCKLLGEDAFRIWEAWAERTDCLRQAVALLKAGEGNPCLAEVILEVFPAFRKVKYYQIVAEMLESFEAGDGVEPDESLLRKALGGLGSWANFLPDLKDAISEFEEEHPGHTAMYGGLGSLVEESLDLSMWAFVDRIGEYLSLVFAGPPAH